MTTDITPARIAEIRARCGSVKQNQGTVHVDLDEPTQTMAVIGARMLASMCNEIERLRAIPGLADVLAGKAVVVPVECTDAMNVAAYTQSGHSTTRTENGSRWQAMLSASPYKGGDNDC